MLLLDNRTGSKELLKYLPDARLVRLEAGDVSFLGHGPDGPVSVGVERKRVNEVIKDFDRYVSVQLPKLQATYQQIYLVVEGKFMIDREAQVKSYPKSRWSLSSTAFYGRLNTLTVMAGVKVVHTYTPRHTGLLVRALYSWWRRKWDEHKSLKVLYTPPPPHVVVTPPSLLRRLAAQLPGVGWERSLAIELHFRTVPRMLLADEVEWRKIPGIGKGLARRIWCALHEDNGRDYARPQRIGEPASSQVCGCH